MLFKKKYNKQKEPKEKRKIPKTVQNTIPYIQAFEDGIIEVRKGYYSSTFKFLDINYQIARNDDQEAIFIKYCNFLNSFDSSIQVQISINNKNINKKDFEDEILIKMKEDTLDEYREEYNEMLKRQVVEGRNDISKEKYITITIQSPTVDEAKSIFARIETEVHNNFKRLGSVAYTLNLKERLEVLHDFYRRGHEGELVFNPIEHKRKGLLTKDLIGPDSFEFKRDHMMIGNKYARAIFIRELPSFINDKFVSEITDFSFNMFFSMNINSVDPDRAIKIVKKQITGMEANKIDYQKRSLKNGYMDAFIPYELRHSLEEAQELLDDIINKNQKMFLVNMVIVHTADDFLIGIIGSKKDAITIKSDISSFLENKLKLKMSEEKTLITNSRSKARFLGYDIMVDRSTNTIKNKNGVVSRYFYNRVKLIMPRDKWQKKLMEYKALKINKGSDGKESWEPIHRGYLKDKPDIEILKQYNSEIVGLYNYYRIVNNVSMLHRFKYVMEYSMYKTFATKYKSTVRKIRRKFNYNGKFAIGYTSKKGSKVIPFYNGGFKRKNFATKDNAIDKIPTYGKYFSPKSLITRVLSNRCEWCFKYTKNVEVHHVRKLKSLSEKKKWESVMIKRNRKTLVLCTECHKNLHLGLLD